MSLSSSNARRTLTSACLRPCTIKQVLEADEVVSSREFRVGGFPVRKVELVVQVIGIAQEYRAGPVNYTVDDSTGRIVAQDMEQKKLEKSLQITELQAYARIHGSITRLRGEIGIRVDNIRPIAKSDLNQIFEHFLSCMGITRMMNPISQATSPLPSISSPGTMAATRSSPLSSKPKTPKSYPKPSATKSPPLPTTTSHAKSTKSDVQAISPKAEPVSRKSDKGKGKGKAKEIGYRFKPAADVSPNTSLASELDISYDGFVAESADEDLVEAVATSLDAVRSMKKEDMESLPSIKAESVSQHRTGASPSVSFRPRMKADIDIGADKKNKLGLDLLDGSPSPKQGGARKVISPKPERQSFSSLPSSTKRTLKPSSTSLSGVTIVEDDEDVSVPIALKRPSSTTIAALAVTTPQRERRRLKASSSALSGMSSLSHMAPSPTPTMVERSDMMDINLKDEVQTYVKVKDEEEELDLAKKGSGYKALSFAKSTKSIADEPARVKSIRPEDMDDLTPLLPLPISPTSTRNRKLTTHQVQMQANASLNQTQPLHRDGPREFNPNSYSPRTTVANTEPVSPVAVSPSPSYSYSGLRTAGWGSRARDAIWTWMGQISSSSSSPTRFTFELNVPHTANATSESAIHPHNSEFDDNEDNNGDDDDGSSTVCKTYSTMSTMSSARRSVTVHTEYASENESENEFATAVYGGRGQEQGEEDEGYSTSASNKTNVANLDRPRTGINISEGRRNGSDNKRTNVPTIAEVRNTLVGDTVNDSAAVGAQLDSQDAPTTNVIRQLEDTPRIEASPEPSAVLYLEVGPADSMNITSRVPSALPSPQRQDAPSFVLPIKIEDVELEELEDEPEARFKSARSSLSSAPFFTPRSSLGSSASDKQQLDVEDRDQEDMVPMETMDSVIVSLESDLPVKEDNWFVLGLNAPAKREDVQVVQEVPANLDVKAHSSPDSLQHQELIISPSSEYHTASSMHEQELSMEQQEVLSPSSALKPLVEPKTFAEDDKESPIAQLPRLEQAIYLYLKRLRIDPSARYAGDGEAEGDDGVHVKFIARSVARLSQSPEEIDQAIENLRDEGFIYDTIDESHYDVVDLSL